MSLLDHEFYSEYELELSAWGEGILREEDLLPMQRLDAAFAKFKRKPSRFPRDISLLIIDSLASGAGYGFTGIDTAFLERLETLKELILPDSIQHIDVTPKIERILKENSTLIRGSFDSFAERFANENGLRFRTSDLVFAQYFFEPAFEGTELTLVFDRDGNVCVREKISSPGSSAGSTFGGSFFHELKPDFYLTDTAEDIAGRFGAALRDAIINDGRLAAFIEKARSHGYYTGANR